jgi:hypothetical protein
VAKSQPLLKKVDNRFTRCGKLLIFKKINFELLLLGFYFFEFFLVKKKKKKKKKKNLKIRKVGSPVFFLKVAFWLK